MRPGSAAGCDDRRTAQWRLRLAEAWRERGEREDLERAEAIFLEAASQFAADAELRCALRDIYRRLERPQALADQIELELAAEPAALSDADARALRLEWSELLADALDAPARALEELLQILAEVPDHAQAEARALTLAERLDRAAIRLKLLDARLAHTRAEPQRASLQLERGALLVGPLERPEEAVLAYREAASLEPDPGEARLALRGALAALERWPELLEDLWAEAQTASAEARPRLLEEAEHTARAKLPPDLRVGWLERLRGARPGDAALLAEIADLHRGAGRSTPLLRSLEAQIALDPTGPKAGPLHLERAQILENALGSNARAIEALEAARSLDADDPAVLARLDRLYEREGRLRERARILEERIRISDGDPPEARIALHRHAAQVWRGVQMPEPELAQRLRAVAAAASAAPAERAVLLRELAESLQRAGRPDLWVRAGEAELRCLGADEAPRRLVLQLALAARYARDGRRPREALAHLQDFFAIAERLRDTPDAAQAEAFEWAEAVRLELLRRDRNFLALADCLERWLATRREDAGVWLELARIREEQLTDPAAAQAAFREALQLRPSDDAALRGLRRTAERLGDWREVVRTLEIALEQANPEPPQARAALLRQLGRLCDERIDAPDQAIEAYSRALEIDASDLVSLRALQSLRARSHDRGAELELRQREIEVLGEAEPERRRALWLRVAELSRDQSGDPARAQRAFEQAARCGALDADQLRTWASLCEQSGDRERQAEVFAAWCDDASTVATGADHRAVAELLEDLGRPEEALARAQRALQISDRDPASWDTTARLHEAVGEPASAADALECAAQLLGGSQAEQRLRRAGKLAEASDLERAECLYRRAAECDPASVAACAQLATTAARRSRWDLAEDAAGRALDLAEAGAGSDPSAPRELMLAAALAGGRAARARDRLEPAARFFSAAAAIDAASPEALDGLGDALHALGDAPGAATAFAKRLDLAGENPRRAHQQAVVAVGRVLGGDPEAALSQFCAALELDPTEPIANAGIVDLHQRAGRVRDAVAALDHWISVCESDPERASLERRAADLELEAGDLEGAERHLRGALRWQPADLGAARPLADLLWNAERAEEALAVATGAIAAGSPGPDRSRLELIRARALEVTHDAPAAAEAFARAFEADPRCAEAAVSCGRLLRSLGRWRDAAAALGAFTDRHPEPDLADLAAIFTERGRLLAGPLEDLQAAVACYERAIALDPGATAPREQLARILSLLPVRRREAVGHHAQLLRADPTSGASLRALSRISAEGGQDGTRARGLALLRTLGLASPEERSEIPSDLALRADAVARLEPALWETLRNAFSEAREALAASLAPPPEPAPRQSLDSPIEAFRRAQRRNFGRLCAEALWGRSGDELNAAARALHDVAFGEKREDLAGRLEAALGSRGRRRLRRALTGVSYSQILDLDFDAWRQALEQMAAAAALSECGGDLRSALLALSAADDRRPDDRAGTNADICARISGSESARALLEAAVRTWCSEVGEAGR